MSKSVTPVVPTFHSITTPCLTKPADVAIYLIRWLFANPGGTSSFQESEMISYRKLVAMYGSKPDELAIQISQMLTAAMMNYFPDGKYSAHCNITDEEGYSSDEHVWQGNKSISINFTDASDEPIIPMGSITVYPDYTFDIKFANQGA